MTSKKRWTEIRERVFRDQAGKCAMCPRVHQSHETMHAHHAIYTKQKGLEKWLDSEENIELMCNDCHSKRHGYLSGWFGRCMAWTKKIDAGYDMLAWNESLPMRIKDAFLYLDNSDEKRGKI